jgi:cellulose synthase/poly-beta-1,6-N-acetylglucosamine synthase-like glycosyltransferase
MSLSSHSEFSLFSIVIDIFYYGFHYLLFLCPFPHNLHTRRERERENLVIKEKLLSTLSSSSNPQINTISIVIPAYNEENHLEATLLAALAAGSQYRSQSRPLEIIVSDGGSKDGTRGVCEKYAARGVRFVTGGNCRAECQNIGTDLPLNI